MAISEEATLQVRLTAQDLTGPAMEQAETRMGRLGNAVTKLAGVFTGVLGSAVIGALSDAARAGADHEASLVRLQTAVDNTTQSYEASSLALEAATKVARQYGFSTIEINDALALLVEQTGSADEAMQRITVAENLARGAHIDLYTASKLLGKATDENANVLARYGVIIEKGADVTTMLATVQAKFGGQAEAYGNTTAGAIDKTKVAMEDWRASIGNSLGPAQQYIALLPGLSVGMTTAGGAIGGATKALAEHGEALKSVAAIAGKGSVVLIALAAVVEAMLQVKETVDFVTDHWNVFVYALRNNKLDNIPVFGFFFSMANNVINALQTIQNLWNAVSNAFNGSAGDPNAGENYNGPPVPGFATGTPYVPRTGLALLHQGEAVIPANQNRGWGGGGITINVSGNVTESEQALADKVGDAIMRTLGHNRAMGF